MAKSVEVTNTKVRSALFTILNVIVTLIAFGIGRTYPLPTGILAAIYFSIVLGVTINKRNVARLNGEDTARITKEIYGYVAWVAVLVVVLGLEVWGAGGFQAESVSSYVSPSDIASRAVQEAKASNTLPKQLDNVTTLTDITSVGSTIQYHYILHDADTSSVTNEALKNSVKPNVCANSSTMSLMNKGVDLEYLYAVSGTEQYSFKITPLDCLN